MTPAEYIVCAYSPQSFCCNSFSGKAQRNLPAVRSDWMIAGIASIAGQGTSFTTGQPSCHKKLAESAGPPSFSLSFAFRRKSS